MGTALHVVVAPGKLCHTNMSTTTLSPTTRRTRSVTARERAEGQRRGEQLEDVPPAENGNARVHGLDDLDHLAAVAATATIPAAPHGQQRAEEKDDHTYDPAAGAGVGTGAGRIPSPSLADARSTSPSTHASRKVTAADRTTTTTVEAAPYMLHTTSVGVDNNTSGNNSIDLADIPDFSKAFSPSTSGSAGTLRPTLTAPAQLVDRHTHTSVPSAHGAALEQGYYDNRSQPSSLRPAGAGASAAHGIQPRPRSESPLKRAMYNDPDDGSERRRIRPTPISPVPITGAPQPVSPFHPSIGGLTIRQPDPIAVQRVGDRVTGSTSPTTQAGCGTVSQQQRRKSHKRSTSRSSAAVEATRGGRNTGHSDHYSTESSDDERRKPRHNKERGNDRGHKQRRSRRKKE